jgi:transcriptional regulator with XRE-family HTH domain
MNRIRELRKAAGLTCAELAALCVPPTSHAQISRLETSKRRLAQDWMERIAPALRCTPADLIANAMPAVVDYSPHRRGSQMSNRIRDIREAVGLRR